MNPEKRQYSKEKKIKKNHLHQAIQEMLANHQKIDFEEETLKLFQTILATLENKLSAME